jgi:anti-anti-sigma factor
LTITAHPGPSVTVLELRGDLDLHTAPRLIRSVEAAREDGAACVAVDAAALEFIDSSGLRALLAARDELVRSGGELFVTNPSSAAGRVIEMTGLESLLG